MEEHLSVNGLPCDDDDDHYYYYYYLFSSFFQSFDTNN